MPGAALWTLQCSPVNVSGRPGQLSARAYPTRFGRQHVFTDRFLGDSDSCRIVRQAVSPRWSLLGSCLARTIHQTSPATGDAPRSVVLSHLGVLNVLSSTLPRPSARKPRCVRHLAGLATQLAGGESLMGAGAGVSNPGE